IMTAEQVEAAIRPNDMHSITTALICIENTHNAGGGTIYPLSTIEKIRSLAMRHGIPMHLDGARLFNAVAATTLPPTAYAQHFETVSLCLSKGLGAPVGSLLLSNDQRLMDRARRFRRMYGGAMRQAGILAAAGIYALERHVGRLKTDHDHAKKLARLLQQIPTIEIAPQHVETNIVMFDIVDEQRSPVELVAALKEHGVLINPVGGQSYRAVTHLHITDKQIDEAAAVFAKILTR
ncbi:MAG: low specificity L-threonine aldolase, partial [Nitrospira sp.]